MTRDEEIAYDNGFADGQSESACDGMCEAWYEGYEKGFEDGGEAALHAALTQHHLDALINPLEDFVVRWDAALSAWVVTQDGREHLLR